MTALQDIAHAIKALTFDDAMTMADWFSGWTTMDESGNEQAATIDAPTMAANISDWADQHLD